MIDLLHRPIHYGLTRTVAPATEPVSVQEAKDWLRVSDTADDFTIQSLIVSAREKVEDDTGLSLLTQTWTWSIDRLPASSRLVLPFAPVQSVTSIKSYDVSDAESTVATSVYRVDTDGLIARIVLKDGQSWPSGLRLQNGLLVTAVCGFGDGASAVPTVLTLAIRMLVEHWFHNRGVATQAQKEIEHAYEAIVGQHKVRVL